MSQSLSLGTRGTPLAGTAMTAVGFLPLLLQVAVACLLFHLAKWPWWLPAVGLATFWLFPRDGRRHVFAWLLWLGVAAGFGWGLAEFF